MPSVYDPPRKLKASVAVFQFCRRPHFQQCQPHFKQFFVGGKFLQAYELLMVTELAIQRVGQISMALSQMAIEIVIGSDDNFCSSLQTAAIETVDPNYAYDDKSSS